MAALDPTIGHEQGKTRPCIIVSADEAGAIQRYPLVALVPLTGTPLTGPLYPRLPRGTAGLLKDSWALTDQVRTADKIRIRGLLGDVPASQMADINRALRFFLGLD